MYNWYAITLAGVIESYFFDIPTYAIDELPLAMRYVGYFQQDGTSAHFVHNVRNFLQHNFSGRWIGRCGHLQWLSHFSDLTPWDFCLWDMIKKLTAQEFGVLMKEKIRNVVTGVTR